MNDLESALRQARDFFSCGVTRPAAFRLNALRRLARAIEARERELLDALHADLRKGEQEAWATEIGVVQTDIAHTIRQLPRWMRPSRRRTSWGLAPSRGTVHADPKGVALILGPWNYPFVLLFSPLVGALAAGNCVCLKTSEYAPSTSSVMARIIGDAFEPAHVRLFEGDAGTARALVELDFDHIFLTGSTEVGRQVMAAAARNLTPVTLELGGKCPCFVCADARLEVAARRIAWGKFLNAGQTCVAPDHVLVHRSVKDRLLAEIRRALTRFYGPDPRESGDYGRIVNRRHFDRIRSYLDQRVPFLGGETDESDLYIAPTLLVDPEPGSAVMTEEIFGPVLPVVGFEDLDSALAEVVARPSPLAVYLFTEDRTIQREFVARTVSGTVGINDVLNQIVPKDLPFGGVGESGMGRYHGRAGFDCFTHQRSVLKRSTRFDPKFVYPPSRAPLETMKRAYRWMFRD